MHLSIAAHNSIFRNSPVQFGNNIHRAGGFGFPAAHTSGTAGLDMMSLFRIMQFMQMLQSGFGAFGGEAFHSPVDTVGRSPNAVPQATHSVAAAPQEDARPSTPEEKKRIETQIQRISDHWVKPLPGSSENPQNLMMRLNKGGVTVPYDPNTPAHEINLVLADSNHLPVSGIHSTEKYWEARTPNGLNRSILSEAMRHQGQDPNIQERYSDDWVRRLAVDGTASEIYPGEHVRHGATNSKIHKDMAATFSSLNAFTSKRHEDKSPEEQQDLHESAKFAIASANFLESGGRFDDKALDTFLSKRLRIEKLESETADGPRGECLAKLGEVTRAIIDGKIDIEEAVDSGIVAKEDVKKFEASVLSVESGKIGADVSAVTSKSTDSEIRETVAKSTTVGSPSSPRSKNVKRI